MLGYAYAHRFQERAAYQWGAELSVYLDRGCVSHGIGSQLYTLLLELLRLQNVRTAYALVTLPNTKSEALHRTSASSSVACGTAPASKAAAGTTWGFLKSSFSRMRAAPPRCKDSATFPRSACSPYSGRHKKRMTKARYDVHTALFLRMRASFS